MALYLTIALYVTCDLIANITAFKPLAIGDIVVPGGVFIYALTFTLIDLINEQLGRKGARKVVFSAFAANALLALYSAFIITVPSPEFFYRTGGNYHGARQYSTDRWGKPRCVSH